VSSDALLKGVVSDEICPAGTVFEAEEQPVRRGEQDVPPRHGSSPG
jgi:hypothetical protein